MDALDLLNHLNDEQNDAHPEARIEPDVLKEILKKNSGILEGFSFIQESILLTAASTPHVKYHQSFGHFYQPTEVT